MEVVTDLGVNDCYIPLLDNEDRYLILYGGAGSGKSWFAAQKILLRVLNEEGHRILVLRKVARTMRESVFSLLKDVIKAEDWSDFFTIKENEMHFRCINGNEIISAGVDDPEKLKSIAGITSVWIEETTELSENEFDQVDLRLRGETKNYKQILLCFNPIDETHWLKKRFFDTHPADCTVTHTTYLDNGEIGKEYKEILLSLKVKNPPYYEVYCLGKWGRLKEGFIFKSDYYSEWNEIPQDARGVIYCDPNLSKKSEGDTTAIVKLLYSASTHKYYIADAVCRSFSDSNELLREVLSMRDDQAKSIAFDGHVNQESTWSMHIQNYCRQRNLPFPVVEFKRYRVDDLAKNAQWVWTDNAFQFPPHFKAREDGERFASQMFSFAGKKAGNKDDAPDALICALEFITERGMTRNNMSAIAKSLLTKHT
jgi:phage terminase large subunit